MKAMLLHRIMLLHEGARPLEFVELPRPEPRPGEVLIRVSTCGVCHTELDEIEGRTAPPMLPIILGHEVVGRVEQLGMGVSHLKLGDRVGVGWIHHSSGDENENLHPAFRATGRDVSGGYAEYLTVPENYAYPIPAVYSDLEAAPLLCAGAIGYRALRLCHIRDGQPLGLTGFGGSAHLVLQLARHLFPRSPVYVFARDARSREFAGQLGAVWQGDTTDHAPEKLAAIIDTTPAWTPVVEALFNLAPGGRLVVNAIRKEDADKSALTQLSYHDHLWMEKEIKSVANITSHDIRQFLPLAAEIPIRPHVQAYPLQQANEALQDLKHGSIQGAKVLVVHDTTT
jgi:alcohol dehydrogenase, propanol-preferring